MFATVAKRSFSTSSPKNFKVAVLGAAGGIGQPLSLLLKSNPLVTRLALYDIVNTPGVAADISHVCTPAKVTGHNAEELHVALQGADVVVIPAGMPRKPGMTRDDLFNKNASIVKTLAEACAKACPKAQLLIISNPVNSTVPIVAETLKKHGVFDPARVFGVTTLDVTRAKTFVAEAKGIDVYKTEIPVIGGHAGITILPLLSQVSPKVSFTKEELDALTHRIQFGGDEVVKAKAGAGSATLSMAYAGAEFTNSVLRGLKGEKGVVACAFVKSHVTDAEYFASKIELGPNGVKEIHGLGPLSDYEKEKLEQLLPELKGSIKKGIEFVANN